MSNWWIFSLFYLVKCCLDKYYYVFMWHHCTKLYIIMPQKLITWLDKDPYHRFRVLYSKIIPDRSPDREFNVRLYACINNSIYICTSKTYYHFDSITFWRCYRKPAGSGNQIPRSWHVFTDLLKMSDDNYFFKSCLPHGIC